MPDAPATVVHEPRRDLVVFALAAVTYIVVGMYWKGVLNWIVGPLWYVAFVLVDARIRRGRRRV